MNILEKRFKKAVSLAKNGTFHVGSFSCPVPVAFVKNKAAENTLEWLPGDDPDDEYGDEVITKGDNVGFELAYDAEGAVYHTIVVRDSNGKNPIGATLSIDKLLKISEWALINGLSQLDFIADQGGELGNSAQNYTLAQTTKILDALKEAGLPAVMAAVEQEAMIQYATAYNERMDKEQAAAELKLRLEMEKKYSAPLLKLAEAFTAGDESILEDPLLQDSLIRAKKLHDDGAEK